MSVVMDLRVPHNARKLLSSCTTGGLSRTWLYGVGQSRILLQGGPDSVSFSSLITNQSNNTREKSRAI
jgi:hypothetical protein